MVPEIAARAHLTSIVPVVDKALADAGVYFDTTSVADYGCLSGQDIDALLAGGGERAVVGESAKRSPSRRRRRRSGRPASAEAGASATTAPVSSTGSHSFARIKG